MITGKGAKCTNNPKFKHLDFYVDKFDEIDYEGIKDRVRNPTSFAKGDGEWLICSDYHSRALKEQVEHGTFYAIWADFDKLTVDQTFEFCRDMLLMCGVEAVVYTTSSHIPGKKNRMRVIMPIPTPVNAKDWKRYQVAFGDFFESLGIIADRSAESCQQVCYLPNTENLGNYQYEVLEGDRNLSFLDDCVAQVDERFKAIEEAAEARAAEKALNPSDGKPEYVEWFNKAFPLEPLMLDLGYIRKSNRPTQEGIMKYQSPLQTTNGYSVDVYPGGERWFSLSGSDSEFGLGMVPDGGVGVTGDASDLYMALAKENHEDKEFGTKFNNDSKKFRAWVEENVLNEDGFTLNQLKMQKMFEDVKGMDKPIPPAPVDEMGCPEILNLEDIELSATGGYTGDHIADGLAAINAIWGGSRLCKMEGILYWYNGAAWIATSDTILRRQMMLTMMSADPKVKLKHAHFEGLLKSVKDLKMDEGQPNPASELIFFKNGVYNIDTGVMMPHDPKYRNTGTLSVVYNPNASGFAWLNWLKDIFEDDLDRIDLLQEMIGWCLISGNLNIHKAMLLVGVQRSGKSTIADILDALLGSRVTGFTLNQLHNPKTLVGCIQATLAIDSEAGGPSKADAGVCREAFKKVSANDSVSITRLYVDGTTKTKLNCKLMAMANEVPQMFDNSNATNDRWAPLVFTKSFIGREDTGLRDRLLKDLEFVAYWAIEGLLRLKRNKNFTMPQTSKNEIDSLRISGNPVSEFIDEMTTLGSDEKCYKEEVWNSFRLWCEIKGDKKPENRNLFYKNFHSALRSRQVEVVRKVQVGGGPPKGGFTGVSLRQPLHSVK